jgi:hypothetical protein
VARGSTSLTINGRDVAPDFAKAGQKICLTFGATNQPDLCCKRGSAAVSRFA